MKKKLTTYLAALLFMAAPALTSCNGDNGSADTDTTDTETTTPENGTTDDHMSGEDAKTGKNSISGQTVLIQTVGNTMDEMRYTANEIRMPANTDVKIRLENKASDAAMEHNLVIVPKDKVQEVAMAGLKNPKGDYLPEDKSMYIAATEVAEPGASTYVEFKSPAPGEYTFVCTYPGHWQQMQGTIIFE